MSQFFSVKQSNSLKSTHDDDGNETKMDLTTAIKQSNSLKSTYDDVGNETKIDLTTATFFDDVDEPNVMKIIRTVEVILASDETRKKEYLPVLGLASFNSAIIKLLLGTENCAIQENRVFGIQTVSGTCGLRVSAEFLNTILKYKCVYLSKPSWDNYKEIFLKACFKDIRSYRYWTLGSKELDIDGMIDDLENAPENAVVMLQLCGHNPTGYDPTEDQWKSIADVIERKNLFPIFDNCAQGLAFGDFDKDAWALRYFVSRRLELFCTISFARIFSLSSNRVGSILVVLNTSSLVPLVRSHFIMIIKGMYSNPPSHGALIITYILNHPQCCEQWKRQMKSVHKRAVHYRKALRNAIEQLHTPGNWSHITRQIGIFCLLEISEAQVKYLEKHHHIYLPQNGRFSITNLKEDTVDQVARAIYDTVTNAKGLCV